MNLLRAFRRYKYRRTVKKQAMKMVPLLHDAQNHILWLVQILDESELPDDNFDARRFCITTVDLIADVLEPIDRMEYHINAWNDIVWYTDPDLR